MALPLLLAEVEALPIQTAQHSLSLRFVSCLISAIRNSLRSIIRVIIIVSVPSINSIILFAELSDLRFVSLVLPDDRVYERRFLMIWES